MESAIERKQGGMAKRLKWVALLGSLIASAIPIPSTAGDSAAGDPELAQAMDILSRGTLASAREAVAKLSEGARLRPTQPLYGKLRGEIEILFRAEHAIPQAQEASEEAEKTAEQKRRSAKLALERSKLTGRNDPVAAERYRDQAKKILADAAEAEALAERNFLLALQRADDLTSGMLEDGEEAVALGLGSALWVITGRNTKYLTSEEETVFQPSISESKLEELKIQVKIRQAWVRQGLEKEKAGDRPGALELFRKAGFEEGIQRLGQK